MHRGFAAGPSRRRRIDYGREAEQKPTSLREKGEPIVQDTTGGPMPAIFISPRRYVQGRGAINRLGDELTRLGSRKPLILRDAVVAGIVDEKLAGVEGAFLEAFGGQCSREEIARVTNVARGEGADSIVGVGGGKTLDVARTVAYTEGLPMVIVPTVAATDSPTSSLAVVYTEDGELEEVRFYERNPDSVVVDTEIIARAPVRFLVAGMGDALATYFEAVTAARTGFKTIAGGTPTEAALAICRLCYDLIAKHGIAARTAVEQNVVTPAVEKVVEANTLLSGLGFESGGTSAAHAFHDGLTLLPGTHHLLHGEKVAFGVVCQLMLEGYPDREVEEVVDLCLKMGLPVTFEDLELGDVGKEDLMRVARRAAAPGGDVHKEPFEVRPEMLLDAMRAADAFGHWRRKVLENEGAPLPTVSH